MKCEICKKQIVGIWHSALPLCKGKCCGSCLKYVVEYRMKSYIENKVVK